MESNGNYIDGSWEQVRSAKGRIERENPANPDERVFETSWDIVSTDRAVTAAREALPEWHRLGRDARVDQLMDVKEELRQRREDFARAIAREVGKPLWEARQEADALPNKIEVMADEGLELTRDRQPEGLDGGRWTRRPLGVVAVLGPYNFPAHLPNGHIVPALLHGNTVVVKPSELTGGVMQIYFECLQEADLPDGVVNLVHGPGEVGRELATHREVNGVLFTGSWDTGRRIKRQTVDHYWKLLALEMGGKNTSIVLEDADLEQAAHEIARAAFLTTGQRCSATSRVVVRSEVADEFLAMFADLARRVTAGHPTGEDPFMGPLASERALEKFLDAQERDEDGVLEPVVRGGRDASQGSGYYVEPAVWLAHGVDASGVHQATEIFGPDVVVYPVESDSAAVDVANATEYGLAMSVFTGDEERFEEMAYDLRTGLLNLNRSTAGASSRLPFGGVKKSGNHRPSAILAGEYCSYPQSQLRESAEWDESSLQEPPFSLLE